MPSTQPPCKGEALLLRKSIDPSSGECGCLCVSFELQTLLAGLLVRGMRRSSHLKERVKWGRRGCYANSMMIFIFSLEEDVTSRD